MAASDEEISCHHLQINDGAENIAKKTKGDAKMQTAGAGLRVSPHANTPTAPRRRVARQLRPSGGALCCPSHVLSLSLSINDLKVWRAPPC